ncbi:MAG: hypothetical protein M1840_001436 [Geoglossum simile]|nr:MAG: hypothetical protein M1840_001436 [Geoglossum simile]
MANPPFLNFYPKNASLHGIEFAARCPPDVAPRTRIVAVCGITDIGDLTSPARDGWFLSDFWMLNHLFRNAPVAYQIWLTCCDPKRLVEQYGRYAYGNPYQERRVVLEERLLTTIQEAGTLRVVEPKVLLEIFLKTVEDESVGNRARCTLLMTPCFSGGWAMNPDLNFTVIATAGSTAESQSWNASLIRGFSGSIVASAIRDAIFATEVIDEGDVGMAHDLADPYPRPTLVQALEIIRACYRGHPPDNQWIKIHFQVEDYEVLQQRLRQEGLWGYVDDKIRYCWN